MFKTPPVQNRFHAVGPAGKNVSFGIFAIAVSLAFVSSHSASAQMVDMAGVHSSARTAGFPQGGQMGGKNAVSPQPNQTYTWDEESTVPGSLQEALPRRWVFNASVSAGFQYDDNLTLQESGNLGSGYFVVAPTVGVKYGPMSSGLSFSLQYTPSFEWYLEDDVGNAVNHNVGATFNWEHGPLRLFGGVTFTSAEGADVDAGERIARDAAAGSLGLSYDYSDKTTFGLTYGTTLFNPEEDKYVGSNRQIAGAFVDYDVTGKTTLGLGGEYEFQEVEKGSDSNAYRFLLRLKWAATSKLTVNAVAGPEIREYTEGDSGLEAYWRLGIDYNFIDTGKTKLSFDVYRNQESSVALVGQAYTATGVVGTFTYNPSSRLQLSAAAGYEFADYTGTSSSIIADRQDHLYFIRPAIAWSFSSRTSLSVFYQFTQNSSSGVGEASFERNSYGVMMNVAY